MCSLVFELEEIFLCSHKITGGACLKVSHLVIEIVVDTNRVRWRGWESVRLDHGSKQFTSFRVFEMARGTDRVEGQPA